MKKIIVLFIMILMPISIYAYSKNIIPGGESIGIKIEPNGLIVVGFYKVNNEYKQINGNLIGVLFANYILENKNITNIEISKLVAFRKGQSFSMYDENKKEENISTDSLPLDILVDLKGSDNTIVTDPIVKDEVTMIKKIKEGETFYSGSFNFSKKDFADEEEDFFDEKSHNGLKIFFLIIGLILLAGVIYLAVTKYILK